MSDRSLPAGPNPDVLGAIGSGRGAVLKTALAARHDGAVAPEFFDATVATVERLYALYEARAEDREQAKATLAALQCSTGFEYEVPVPAEIGGGTVVIDDAVCGLPTGHEGSHVDGYDSERSEPVAYAQAVQQYEGLLDAAYDALEDWEDERERLTQLECAEASDSKWPCVLRRGHAGAHEHPTAMRIIS